MTAALFLNLVIAGLLVVTIGYCWQLNRRLSTLRQGREELVALVTSLNQVTQRAEAGISALQAMAKDAGAELQKTVKKAQDLRDELALITETGNNLANRLENRLTTARSSVDLGEVRAQRRQPPRAPDNAARHEILKALQAAR
jgi:ABC-type transporter Mla subunit MlaD